MKARMAVAIATVSTLMKITANIWPRIKRINGRIITPPDWTKKAENLTFINAKGNIVKGPNITEPFDQTLHINQ